MSSNTEKWLIGTEKIVVYVRSKLARFTVHQNLMRWNRK